MRKLFSLLTAVLFAGSMMAIDFTLSSAESVTKDGVTVTFAKGSGANAPAWYTAGLRLYASNTVTISSESNITAISFNWEKQGSKAFNTVTASTGSYTHPTEAGVGAWTGSATSVTFTLGASGQLQLKTFSVTVGEGGGDTPGGDTPGGDTPGGDDPVVTDPTNCAEAAAAALTVSKNNEEYNGGKSYTIQGYVTAIQTAFNSTYKQVSFWMADTENGGNVLQAYRAVCETAADAPAVGDKVAVTGKLTKYGTTPEFAQGCTYVITQKTTNLPVNLGPKTIAEFLELKNTKDTCVLTGIIANVANTQYGNFDLVELGNAEVKVYVYGLLTAAGETKKCFEEEGLAEGDTLTIKAVYTTYNNAPQAQNAIFVEVKKAGSVTPGAEVEITIADGSFGDYVESYGFWMVEAQNDDYYISLSNEDLEIAQAAGTYTAADLYAEDSYILTETDSISFVSGSIVLAVDAEGVATVTGSLVGNDGNTYILNIVCPAPDEHEYDDDSDFIRNFSSYTIDTEYLSEYGEINVEASDEAGYQIVLDLYVPTGASGLVAGTYEINSTYEAGTVAAGIFYDGGIYPSFAGIATTEGLTNVWYLVSGTVVVDANLNITVNALNSLGHTIKVTLSAASQTGIEETLAAGKAAKVVRDGQVRILKAEKTFNVTGARIR